MIAHRSWSRQRPATFRYRGENPSSRNRRPRTSAIEAVFPGWTFASMRCRPRRSERVLEDRAESLAHVALTRVAARTRSSRGRRCGTARGRSARGGRRPTIASSSLRTTSRHVRRSACGPFGGRRRTTRASPGAWTQRAVERAARRDGVEEPVAVASRRTPQMHESPRGERRSLVTRGRARARAGALDAPRASITRIGARAVLVAVGRRPCGPRDPCRPGRSARSRSAGSALRPPRSPTCDHIGSRSGTQRIFSSSPFSSLIRNSPTGRARIRHPGTSARRRRRARRAGRRRRRACRR